MGIHFKATRISGFSECPLRPAHSFGTAFASLGLHWYNPGMIAGTTTPLRRRFATQRLATTHAARLLALMAACTFYIESAAQTAPAEPSQPPVQSQPLPAAAQPAPAPNPAQIPAISQPAPVATVMAPQPPVGEWTAAAKLGPAQASFFVQEVGTGSPWVEINARGAQNPASLMKLVTTYAALESLGPAATFRTTVWATGQRSSGGDGARLMGNLYIRGGGDPGLTIEDFWSLLRQVRLQGIREIRGDIVLDRSLYSLPDADPNAFDGEGQRAYNVGPDALLIGFKSVRFAFALDETQKQWLVTADPKPPRMRIDANVSATPGPCGEWRSQLTMNFEPDLNPPRASFGGRIPAACANTDLYRALFLPDRYLATVVRQIWEDSGGLLAGGVKAGELPADARFLAERASRPVAELIRDINKRSNNVMARMLMLNLAAYAPKPPGTAADAPTAAPVPKPQQAVGLAEARMALTSALASRGLSFPELVIDNGSGLSRQERISAANLGRVLLAAWASPHMPEYMSSLPVVGVDGTMRRRLQGSAVTGYAHIKTGTLRDSRGIAGYVVGASGRRYAVVSIINGDGAASAQSVHDQFLAWVRDRG